MILFDPAAVAAALGENAEALRASVDAPATLVRVDLGALSVSAASGVSDLETAKAAGVDQTFEIGSQTKLMTAVAILQLAEDGKVDLDTAAAAYLPAQTITGIGNSDTVTVRQLLNMTSGIDNYTEVVDAGGTPEFINALLENPDQIFGPEEALGLVRGLPAVSEPGATFHYSNTNYTLLGRIVEELTGKAFFAALRDGIFAPAGMSNTHPQLSTDDPRLSSYLDNPATGQLLDVTRAQWDLRGEAGVASTTTDMIAFLKALFLDKSLIGEASLAEMMQFVPTGANEEIETGFGLGLVKFTFVGGDTWLGFTGGTLATASSTYLNLRSGEIIAVAGTSDTLDTLEGGFGVFRAVAANASFHLTDDGGPLHLASGSATDLHLARGAGGIDFKIGNATLTLDRTMAGITTANVSFADGSVLVVGDNRAEGRGDRDGNSIDILRDFATASDANNQLSGLAGDDTLAGGHGADRITGGTGSDRLSGRAGADKLSGQGGDDLLQGGNGSDFLSGGAGNDTLIGGRGGDLLSGGAGNDRFVFGPLDQGRDTITDFERGIDLVDLRRLGSDITWIGSAAFGGHPELRVMDRAGGSLLMADLDGDGRADLTIMLRHVHGLTEADLLL